MIQNNKWWRGIGHNKISDDILFVWWSGVVVSALASINEVNQRRARLVLNSTVSGFSSRWGTFISVCDQPPRSTQPGHPSWVGIMSTSQRAVMPCGWGVNAGMVCVWVAGKTVWFPCYMRAISERFRNKELIYKALYKFAFFTLLYSHQTKTEIKHLRTRRWNKGCKSSHALIYFDIRSWLWQVIANCHQKHCQQPVTTHGRGCCSSLWNK